MSYQQLPPPTADYVPNWIDHRASLCRVDERRDKGATVEICPACGCELDIVPAPHSPRCTQKKDHK